MISQEKNLKLLAYSCWKRWKFCPLMFWFRCRPYFPWYKFLHQSHFYGCQALDRVSFFLFFSLWFFAFSYEMLSMNFLWHLPTWCWYEDVYKKLLPVWGKNFLICNFLLYILYCLLPCCMLLMNCKFVKVQYLVLLLPRNLEFLKKGKL